MCQLRESNCQTTSSTFMSWSGPSIYIEWLSALGLDIGRGEDLISIGCYFASSLWIQNSFTVPFCKHHEWGGVNHVRVMFCVGHPGGVEEEILQECQAISSECWPCNSGCIGGLIPFFFTSINAPLLCLIEVKSFVTVSKLGAQPGLPLLFHDKLYWKSFKGCARSRSCDAQSLMKAL
jgi:hypothetical protein